MLQSPNWGRRQRLSRRHAKSVGSAVSSLILLALLARSSLKDNHIAVVAKCKVCNAFIYSAETANCRAILIVMR
jgi:hypothetical protein